MKGLRNVVLAAAAATVLTYLLQIQVLALGSDARAAPILAVDLRCELAESPMGVDSAAPRLSWSLGGDKRGDRQTAYQIKVTGRAGAFWDSGKVMADQTQQIPYQGLPLKSAQQAIWQVRVWDRDGNVSTYSRPGRWTMGLLRPSDWGAARWITSHTPPKVWSELIGYHAAETTAEDDVKWVQVDLKNQTPLSTVRLYPMRHAGKDGFGFPLQYKVEAANTPDFRQPILIDDQTGADHPPPGVKPVIIPAHGVTARYVRVTATRLWKRDATVYAFALRRLEADTSEGRDAAAGAAVTAKDSTEFSGWGKAALTSFSGAGAEANLTDSLLLRRSFFVKPHLTRAVAFVCGLGQYEMSINGVKVGTDVLAPGWTKYDKTCLYDTREITSLLRAGAANAAGLILGNGMYNVHAGRYTKFVGSFGPQKAICQIRLEYANGAVEFVGTDHSWRVIPGPITFSSVYGGEDFDARISPTGWDLPTFNDSQWEVSMEADGPGGVLRGQGSSGPPVRTFEEFAPISAKALRPGVVVYDLGQNASLMPRISVVGSAGSTVTIRPAELLHPDGSLDTASVGDAPAYWEYTLAGRGVETYFPKFFYHGCRYLQLERKNPTGGPLPEVKSLTGVVIGSASPAVGHFACSSDLFNRIYTLVRWAQRSNMVSIMTDCPHRERLGWLEEDHLNGPSLRYDFDLNALFRKIEGDMGDSQTPEGLVPSIAPEYPIFGGGFRDSPEWGSAVILIPWQQYEFTGDLSLFRQHYEAMKRYVAHLTSRSRGNILDYGLGDWYDIGPKPPGPSQLTPIALTATAFYYQDALILARAGTLIGRSEDSAHYASLAAEIKTAFNQRFWNAGKGVYATGSQTANSIPLVMDLAPASERERLVSAIVQDVQSHGNAVTAGDVGYRYLLKALAEGGCSDIIFAMNNQSDRPGYGYQLKMGATSLTEAWDALRTSSQNHFMLGQIMEWFYAGLAGIQADPAAAGFRKIVFKPAIVGNLTSAGGTYDSVLGRVASNWKRTGNKLTLSITLPPNTTATVYMPAHDPASVTEGGKPAAKAIGVCFLKREGTANVYHVGSGSYSFTSQ